MSLPSWNDTPTKQAILDFVAKTSDEGSPDYIPPAERIAAFDNDGTLWVEQPAPGADKESNWLPAPNGPFGLALRLYWPDQDVLDGTWTPSPIKKV